MVNQIIVSAQRPRRLHIVLCICVNHVEPPEPGYQVSNILAQGQPALSDHGPQLRERGRGFCRVTVRTKKTASNVHRIMPFPDKIRKFSGDIAYLQWPSPSTGGKVYLPLTLPRPLISPVITLTLLNQVKAFTDCRLSTGVSTLIAGVLHLSQARRQNACIFYSNPIVYHLVGKRLQLGRHKCGHSLIQAYIQREKNTDRLCWPFITLHF